MADYQNLSAPQLNQINGSSSALGEGTFKRRDELRRAESLQRNKIKMGERLDRSINRAAQKGDIGAANAFNNLRQAISGQGFGGNGGIGNSSDREQRVQDGAVKAADIRYKIGNIGNTNPADGPIANAPPPIEKPQGGSASSSSFSGVPILGGVLDAAPQTAPEAASAPSLSPSATPQSQGSIADVSAKRAAVAQLRDKFTKSSIDTDSMQADYKTKNGDPTIQAAEALPIERSAPSKSSTPELDRIKAKYTGKGLGPNDVEKSRNLIGMGEKEYHASQNDQASIDRGKKASVDYDEAEKKRIFTRDARFAASEEKLKSEFEKADKGYIVARKQSQDYFSDLEKNSNYNSSLGIIKRATMDSRSDPAPPEILNYDTFDPEAPNMGQKKPLYQSVYGGPEDTYKSLGIDKDSKGNRNIVVKENENYYGPTYGYSFKKDADGNRNLHGLKKGKQRQVNGNIHEYKAAIERYFKPAPPSELLPR